MNIHTRFILHLLGRLILTGFLLLLSILIIFIFIAFLTMNSAIEKDLTTAEGLYFSDRFEIKDGNATIDQHLQELLQKQHSWLIILDSKRDIAGSYGAPDSVLSSKHLLSAANEVPFTDIHTWEIMNMDDKPSYAMLGKQHPEEQWLSRVKDEVDWRKGEWLLSTKDQRQLKKEGVWIQLTDPDGKVLQAYGDRPPSKDYTYKDLLQLDDPNQTVHQDLLSGNILISGVHPPAEAPISVPIHNGWFIALVVIALLILFSTFWYARNLGTPLLIMVKWIKQLSDGQYSQPVNQVGESTIYKRNGKLKRNYRLYKELFSQLSKLTDTLKSNERHEKKVVSSREEWISGLSHDLKTPLSSITGYAQMLQSDQYEWTPEEIRGFAGTIVDKSAFMKDLLDDLTLVYQLNSQALPIRKEKTDINEAIRRSVIYFINTAQTDIRFLPTENPLLGMVDRKWFQRILDNLLSNAIKHNRDGTAITISADVIENQLMVIKIEDDGEGMDAVTLSHLFQRFYRGTNTSDSGSGTGLGMAITKQLIELHNGSINVQSAPDEGTRVRLILPL